MDLFSQPLIIFKSIYDKLFLIFSNSNNSIISYNINENKLIAEIKNCHNNTISHFKHFFDKNKKRDIIMSLSYEDNNLKLWDAYNWENILNIPKVNNNGYLYSACFLNKPNDFLNNILILTCNFRESNEAEEIKIFNLKGNKINEIKNSNENTFSIESFYDIKLSKNFIITGNKDYVKSYDFDDNQLYFKYQENGNGFHYDIILKDNENIIKLLESCYDGFVRIWDFHSNLLLNKILVSSKRGFIFYKCLWNNDYLFSGIFDRISLFNLKDGANIEIMKNIYIDIKYILCIKLPKYGDCLILLNDDKIQLLSIQKIYISN